jgi:hypothetical protein
MLSHRRKKDDVFADSGQWLQTFIELRLAALCLPMPENLARAARFGGRKCLFAAAAGFAGL